MLPLAERIGWNKRKGGDSRRSPRLAAKRRKQDSDSLSLKEVPKPPAFRPRVSGHQQSFSLRPDEYDIVLIIDAMEQTGNRRNKGVFHVCTCLELLGIKSLSGKIDELWSEMRDPQGCFGRFSVDRKGEGQADTRSASSPLKVLIRPLFEAY